MSRGINKVILIGNLGQDPEIRHMSNGGIVANINIATSENWKDKHSGEIREKTEWHRVVLFGKLAEIAGEFLKKGSQVYIEGSLQTRKWQDQRGQDRYTTEVVVNVNGTMQMLGNRKNIQNIQDIKNEENWKNLDQSQDSKFKFKKDEKSDHWLEKEDTNQKNEDSIDFDDDIPF